MFRTILVPVDLNEVELSKKAIEVAVSLAENAGGAIRLVNVQQALPSTYMDYVPADFVGQQTAWANGELETLAKKVPLPRARVSTHIRVGGIYPEILSEAEEWGADLIVIGSHRPAMSTYLLGSNAKTVVRHAKCSVMVVRD